MELQTVDFVQSLTEVLRREAPLVIDADTHITDLRTLSGDAQLRYERSEEYYHGRPQSAEELLVQMDLAKVDLALSWLDPASLSYGPDPDRNAELLLAANRYVRDAAWRHLGRIIPAGWTDPKACGVANAVRIVEICVKQYGFFMMKMNPAQNQYPMESQEVFTVTDAIVSLGAVPAFHFGADSQFTPASAFERLVRRHPNHPIVGVHMGGGGAGYLQAEALSHTARQLGLECPNLHYILSAKRDAHMGSDLLRYRAAGPPFYENLFCASDAPYGCISFQFGGFRQLLRSLEVQYREQFPPETSAGYLGGNFARFALKAYERLMRRQNGTGALCRS